MQSNAVQTIVPNLLNINLLCMDLTIQPKLICRNDPFCYLKYKSPPNIVDPLLVVGTSVVATCRCIFSLSLTLSPIVEMPILERSKSERKENVSSSIFSSTKFCRRVPRPISSRQAFSFTDDILGARVKKVPTK